MLYKCKTLLIITIVTTIGDLPVLIITFVIG